MSKRIIWLVLTSALACAAEQPLIYATTGADGSIWGIDPEAGKIVANILVNPTEGAYGIAFSPDGKRIYVAGGATLSVVDAADYSVKRMDLGSSGFSGVMVSPDGRWVFASNSKEVVAVDSTTLKPVRSFAVSFFVGVTTDSTRLVGATNGWDVYAFDIRSGQRGAWLADDEALGGAGLAPDGRRL